jgi:hypothetical protein
MKRRELPDISLFPDLICDENTNQPMQILVEQTVPENGG